MTDVESSSATFGPSTNKVRGDRQGCSEVGGSIGGGTRSAISRFLKRRHKRLRTHDSVQHKSRRRQSPPVFSTPVPGHSKNIQTGVSTASVAPTLKAWRTSRDTFQRTIERRDIALFWIYIVDFAGPRSARETIRKKHQRTYL